MYYYSIFQQLFNFIPRYRFEKSVESLSGDHYSKTFSTWQQFLTCLYAQITGKDSLREIERGLIANHNRLYHLGMTVVAKSMPADYYRGQTIQSFFQLLDRALYLDEEPLPVISKSLMSFYRSVDTIIIDGVSKLSTDVFYAMDIRLCQAAYDTEYKGIPFAGKQIIVLDDPTQKPRLRLGKAEQKYVKDTFGVLYASKTSLWEDLNFKRVQFHEEDHSRFKK